MSGSSVILSTATVTTDAQATLTFNSARYTDVTFTLTNPSASQGIYRIVTGNMDYTDLVPRTLEVAFEPNETKSIVAAFLPSGNKYNFFLQRKEFDSWVKQGSVRTASVYEIKDVNVSTSSSAAVVSWTRAFSTSHTVRLYDTSNNSTQIEQVTADLNTSTNKYEAVFSGLSNTINYRISIQTVEKSYHVNNGYFNQWKAVGYALFTPSDKANLEIDSVYASYTELSWDDGDVGQYEEDEEAEFKLYRRPTDNSVPWVVLLDWTPDTTRKFTDTGLTPGVEYRYDLNRKGVDGDEVLQDTKYVTTKSSRVTIGEIGSKTLGFSWTPVYDGVTYFFVVNGRTHTTSGTSTWRQDLSPDTGYTLELYVSEQGERVLLSSLTQRTDKSSFISLDLVKHTEVSYDLHNMSSQDSTTFYVANENEYIRSIDFSTGQEITNLSLRGFRPGSTHNLSLFRKENGVWVKQEAGGGLLEHLAVTTKEVSASTSVASRSSMIQWDEGYSGASYGITLFDIVPDGDRSAAVQTLVSNDITNTGGLRSAIITGLDMATQYWGVITATESNTSNVPEDIAVGMFTFTTSAGATLITGEVKASSVFLEWDAGDVEEADGVAEFKLRKQEVSVGTWTDATSWLPHDTTSFAKITGLKAGTAYKFELVRMGLGGNAVSQATVDATTKTSTLTISGTASSSIQVGWTEIYPGASYLLMYTVENGTPETFGGGPISQTSALLDGLESSTKYVVELYCIEDNVVVGLQTQKLGSAASAETGTSKVVVAGAAIVGVAAVGLIVYKMKFAAKTKALV